MFAPVISADNSLLYYKGGYQDYARVGNRFCLSLKGYGTKNMATDVIVILVIIIGKKRASAVTGCPSVSPAARCLA